MPGGDGTGPQGMGSMTGRGAGYCAGFATPGSWNPYVRGGFGRGRGYRNWYYATGLPRWARGGAWTGQPPFVGAAPFAAPVTPESEASDLKAQAAFLRTALESIDKRLADLQAQSSTSTEG